MLVYVNKCVVAGLYYIYCDVFVWYGVKWTENPNSMFFFCVCKAVRGKEDVNAKHK